MTTWSGLAPAVDAHLRRWAAAKVQLPYAADMVGGAKLTPAQADAALIGQLGHWLAFARSYGLPDAKGRVSNSYAVIDRETGEIVDTDGATISGAEKFEDTKESVRRGCLMHIRETVMLDRSTSHYVSGEVIDEVTLAASLAGSDVLHHTDVFTPAGFAVLEHPIMLPDLDVHTGLPRDDVHIPIRAIGWDTHGGILHTSTNQVGDGVTIFLYSNSADYRAIYLPEYRAAYDDAEEDLGDMGELIDTELFPVEVIPWSFGVDWQPREVIEHTPGTVPKTVAWARRWFLAFQRLCWQQIIVRRAEHQHRQTLRRWDRLANRKELLDYSVLRLRRVVDPFYKPEGMGAALEERQWVRAHWKMQYLPSMGGPARLADGSMNPLNHRQVWVEAYWRGPEDGPLGPLHSATSVVR